MRYQAENGHDLIQVTLFNKYRDRCRLFRSAYGKAMVPTNDADTIPSRHYPRRCEGSPFGAVDHSSSRLEPITHRP